MMTTVLMIAAILCILEFIVVTVMAVLQLFPKKEKEEPINKFPYANITLQFETEDGCLYTLYNDFTWDIDTEY